MLKERPVFSDRSIGETEREHSEAISTTIAMGYTPGQERGCIGAAVFLGHVREGGLRANRTFRLREQWCKEFEREELDTDAPMFTSKVDFVAVRTMTLSD